MDEQKLKRLVLGLIENQGMKWLARKITASCGGFWGWLVGIVCERFWDEIAEPLINFGVRKALLEVDRRKGKILIKRIQEAKDEKDIDKYITNISDI